ncbi:MAG TPA: hypothetical protein PKY30_09760, partial [Myxococcota bacterium]|nr:hypothetical protein [Myxococcota bacterium]
MNYLVGIRTWLRKVLSLPRIDLRSVLVIGGFLFVGLPMMGDALQMSLDLVWPDAAQSIPARLVFAFVFFALAVYLLEKNSLPLEEKEEGNPKPRRFVVVLASEKLPVDLAPLQQGTRDERFSAFQKLAGSYSWLGGVVRIVEWHAP